MNDVSSSLKACIGTGLLFNKSLRRKIMLPYVDLDLDLALRSAEDSQNYGNTRPRAYVPRPMHDHQANASRSGTARRVKTAASRNRARGGGGSSNSPVLQPLQYESSFNQEQNINMIDDNRMGMSVGVGVSFDGSAMGSMEEEQRLPTYEPSATNVSSSSNSNRNHNKRGHGQANSKTKKKVIAGYVPMDMDEFWSQSRGILCNAGAWNALQDDPNFALALEIQQNGRFPTIGKVVRNYQSNSANFGKPTELLIEAVAMALLEINFKETSQSTKVSEAKSTKDFIHRSVHRELTAEDELRRAAEKNANKTLDSRRKIQLIRESHEAQIEAKRKVLAEVELVKSKLLKEKLELAASMSMSASEQEVIEHQLRATERTKARVDALKNDVQRRADDKAQSDQRRTLQREAEAELLLLEKEKQAKNAGNKAETADLLFRANTADQLKNKEDRSLKALGSFQEQRSKHHDDLRNKHQLLSFPNY